MWIRSPGFLKWFATILLISDSVFNILLTVRGINRSVSCVWHKRDHCGLVWWGIGVGLPVLCLILTIDFFAHLINCAN